MPPLPRPQPRIPGDLSRGNRVGVIGDSMAGDTSNLTSGIIAPRNRIFPWLCYLSEGRARYCDNKGVNGEDSTEIEARFLTDVVQQTPKWDKVLILAGTNDTLSGSMSTTKTNIQSMVRMARAAKIEPILATLTPANGRSTAERTAVDTYNQWLMLWGASQGLVVLDLMSSAVDPTNGNWKSGYSDDTLHPSLTGAYDLAVAVLDQWLRAFPESPLPLHNRQLQGNNLLLNGCVQGGTTNGVSANWSVGGNNQGTKTATVEAAFAPRLGNVQKVVFAGTAPSYDVTAVGATSGFSVGDRIAFFGWAKFSDMVAGQSYALIKAVCTGASSPASRFLLHNTVLDLDWFQFYNEFTVPSGTTKIDGAATLTAVNGSGGQGTVEVAQFTMLNLTTLGVF